MTDVLIFGVDGMSRRVMERIPIHYVPTFKMYENYDDTAYGEFHSMAHNYPLPETGVCWPTIYTGVGPKQHGHTHGGWTEGDSNFHGIYTIWDKLADEDYSLGLWGMPMTYHAKPLNNDSFMVSGFVATTIPSLFDKHGYWPDNLEEDLPDDMIQRTSTFAAKCLIKNEDGEKVGGAQPADRPIEPNFELLKEKEMERLEAFKDVVEERGAPDIVAYGTTFVDKMGHIMPELDERGNPVEDTHQTHPDDEWTQKTYEVADDILLELADLLDPDHVIVISDHGFYGGAHDFHGYFLNTEGTHFGSEPINEQRDDNDLVDFAPFLLNMFDIEYNQSEYGTYDAEAQAGLSSEEKEDVRGRLEDLGYETDKDGTGGV